MCAVWCVSQWHHQMETFSALLALCAGNSPVTGEFPAQRPLTRSFDVFFDPRLNKRLSKQSSGWWFETPSRPLWRHCDVLWFVTDQFHLYPSRLLHVHRGRLTIAQASVKQPWIWNHDMTAIKQNTILRCAFSRGCTVRPLRILYDWIYHVILKILINYVETNICWCLINVNDTQGQSYKLPKIWCRRWDGGRHGSLPCRPDVRQRVPHLAIHGPEECEHGEGSRASSQYKDRLPWEMDSHYKHYSYVIMSAMASQITSLTIVYSTVYSGADQRKHQRSASLAFVRGIHRWIPRTKGQ